MTTKPTPHPDAVAMSQGLLRLLESPDYIPANVPQLLTKLDFHPNRQQQLQEVLRDLMTQGQVIRQKGGRYVSGRKKEKLISGIIRINRAGKGFLERDEPAPGEVVIPAHCTGTALHGDRVLVRINPPKRGRATPDGETTASVMEVVKRQRSEIVGTLQRGRDSLFVIPDDPRIPHQIQVPPVRDTGRLAQPGDKVVVELQEWSSSSDLPKGLIIEVLGPPDQEGVDMLSVLRAYHLPLHFPNAVTSAADAIAGAHPRGEPLPDERKERVDCTGHCVVTIDPDDAKDFDDAICLEKQTSGQWKLWVHIADVSHYVQPGSVLDVEARLRGNSTYLVDRVIPMLPEGLSNELCSLKAGVNRLTKCVEFLLTDEGRVIRAQFYSAIIHSKRRFSYQEALAVIQGAPAKEPIGHMVQQAHRLAQKIRAARMKAGSLELDFPEAKIRLDDHGKVLRVEKIENDVSHQLIEEFMLLANEAVATRLMELNRPAVYRVHESPSEARLEEYRQDVLSHNIPCGNLSLRPEIQKLLQRLHALPIGSALKIGFLKSLMRARYDVKPLGHYGLSKNKYTHFTSPIRRYADLLVHRALFEERGPALGVLREAAAHLSQTERNSADAERDSRDIKLFAYLNAQIKSGHPVKYTGLVIDVRNFGVFVDVPELGMSGLVPLNAIRDDYYSFDSARNHIKGQRTQRIIKVGDTLPVQVARVDTFKKQVDFALVSDKPVMSKRKVEDARSRNFNRPKSRRRPR